MNISEAPISYNTLAAAYSSIRNQYDYDYVCQVKDITVDDKEVYYIDVQDKDTGNFVGYLGEYNG